MWFAQPHAGWLRLGLALRPNAQSSDGAVGALKLICRSRMTERQHRGCWYANQLNNLKTYRLIWHSLRPKIRLPQPESVDILDVCGDNFAAAGDSSSGKTTDSGSVNRGSSPRSPAINCFTTRRIRLEVKDTVLSGWRSRVQIPYALPEARPKIQVKHVAHSSSGLGHRPLKAEITGSNPVCATIPLCFNVPSVGSCTIAQRTTF